MQFKRCSSCKWIKPDSYDFFYYIRLKRRPLGEGYVLGNKCRKCCIKDHDPIYKVTGIADAPEGIPVYAYRVDPIERKRKRTNKHYLAQYRLTPERYTNRNRVYRQINHLKEIKRHRIYRQKNRANCNSRVAKWRKQYPLRTKAQQIERRARDKGLPHDFTEDDILYALDYWQGFCAYCGNPLEGLFTERPHFDHFIPLSCQEIDNPGSTPHNLVPTCSECNRNKQAKLPLIWLTGKYGKRRARKIMAEIEAFFATVRQS